MPRIAGSGFQEEIEVLTLAAGNSSLREQAADAIDPCRADPIREAGRALVRQPR